MKIQMFTDGACSGNQNEKNSGGWGAILKMGSHEKEIYGGESNTTNNRMELTGVIEAFSALRKPNLDVDVFTDSAYIANCFKQKWYVKWRNSNWKNAAKKPVENRDLWEKLLALVENHNVRFFKVKGHVNPSSTEGKWKELHEKFLSTNGVSSVDYPLETFKELSAMNSRVDALAVLGAEESKVSKS